MEEISSSTSSSNSSSSVAEEKKNDETGDMQNYVDSHCALFEGVEENAYTDAHRDIWKSFSKFDSKNEFANFDVFACMMAKRGAELDGEDGLASYYEHRLEALKQTRQVEDATGKETNTLKSGLEENEYAESAKARTDTEEHHPIFHEEYAFKGAAEEGKVSDNGDGISSTNTEDISDKVTHELFELLPYCSVDTETCYMVADFVNSNVVEASTARDADGNSVLMGAVQHNVASIVRLLAERYGMSTTASNNEGCTPLHYAQSAGIARILVENGGMNSLDVADIHYGCTPLHFAAQCKDGGVLRVLVEAGADLKALDLNGFRAVDYAKEANLQENVDLLHSAMASRAKETFRRKRANSMGSPFDRSTFDLVPKISLASPTAETSSPSHEAKKEEKSTGEKEESDNTSNERSRSETFLTDAQMEMKIKDAVEVALSDAREKWQAKERKLLAKIDSISNAKERLLMKFAKEQKLRRQLHNELEDLRGKVRVFCRVRPLSSSEKEKESAVALRMVDEYMVSLDFKKRSHTFEFDRVFGEHASQSSVFEDVKSLTQSVLDGYNVCIFAYGQTGSGKTYTMMGNTNDLASDDDGLGVAPRASNELFRLMRANEDKYSYKVRMSLYEVYREQLLDLTYVDPDEKANVAEKKKMFIKLDDDGRVEVKGGRVVGPVESSNDLIAALKKGMESRKTSSTLMNKSSSRSHLVLMIFVETTNITTGQVSNGKLTLVDLAGSERATKTGATGQTLKEAQAINKSLSCLGNVISALTSGAAHVPYRDSTLTQLMRDCIGGNAKTLMFVNVSPAEYNSGEGFSSLNFAKRCKKIENKAVAAVESKQLRHLKEQLRRMRKEVPSTDPRISPKKSGRLLLRRPHRGAGRSPRS